MASTLPRQALRLAQSIATGQHRFSALVAPLLFVADAFLCALIIWKVPCTPKLPPPLKMK